MIGAVGYKVITLNRNQKELYPTMNTFTKKSLHVALAGLGTLSLAGAANAVMVNPNGLGQVLIYPYYTVRGIGPLNAATYNTLLSIVNTTNSVKSVKVRFKEGKASKEVLDFNVFLSPKDMWTAAVEPDGAGGAQIETADNSCTIPTFTGPIKFRTTVSASDVIGKASTDAQNLDRITEGYFEVFEMATYDPASVVAINATHSNNVPKDCTQVTDTTAATAPLGAPSGGLSGGASLINVLSGDDFTEDATALTQFWTAGVNGSYSTTGVVTPNYSSAFPAAGATNGLGQIVTAVFPSGQLAVTAALQKTLVVNEFVLDKATLSGTDWVITFPTKAELVTESSVALPFQNVLSKTGSCDDTVVTTYNREEGKVTPGGPDFSPSPTPTGFALCWESNIITFKNDIGGGSGVFNVLGSGNNYTLSTKFINGWGNLTFRPAAINVGTFPVGFDPTAGLTFVNSTTFSGLPTIGFAAQTFVNGTLTDSGGHLIQSSYGGNFGHRYIGPQ
jgi:hypothetical protein